MKELANFNLENMANNGWVYRDGLLEKHLDQTTITIQENEETHDYNAYITHYTNTRFSSKEDESTKFQKRFNLAKNKIIYLGRVIDDILIDKDSYTETKVEIELYNIPAIICKETFQQKVDSIQRYFFDL